MIYTVKIEAAVLVVLVIELGKRLVSFLQIAAF